MSSQLASAEAASTGITTIETALTQEGCAAPADVLAPRALGADEEKRIVDWLDDRLRDGQHGALEAEYPLSIGTPGVGSRIHRVVFEGSEPVAHAMLHPTTLVARGARLPVGLIGNVYTDPEYRGRGLARACIEACLAEARARSLTMAMLWSELDDFYSRIGFHACGRETYLSIDCGLVSRAWAQLQPAGASGDAEKICVSAARASDFKFLDRMYAYKPVRAERGRGSLERLSRSSGTRLVVARAGDAPLAYAALGRGPDFPGVIHEWAGDAAGILACLSELCQDQPSLLVLTGPEPDAAITRLRDEGASSLCVHFARVYLLNAETLWQSIAPRDSRVSFASRGEDVRIGVDGEPNTRISREQATRLLFDAELPQGLPSATAELLRTAIPGGLPWPLYLWGFDSI